MPEFRKWILALSCAALATGIASAQVGGQPGGTGSSGGSFTCGVTNGAVTPTLRAEGYTEEVGDIVLICSGGSPLANGSVIPTANITVFLNTTVTSRLLSTTSNASEALLLIDEPGSALAGYGPSVPQVVCTTPNVGAGPGGCVEYVGESTTESTAGIPGGGVPVNTLPTALNCVNNGITIAPCGVGANVFQGISSGNQVTFNGIPVMAPATAGATRVYRITNIRGNANQIVSGGATPGAVTASLSINSATSIIISNSTLTVGFVQPGLAAAFRTATNSGTSSGASLSQCSSVSVTSTSSVTSAIGLVQFTENFATAFKVRASANPQNVPGFIYNSESNFFGPNLPSASVSSTGAPEQAGLADYGTRLKATFNNVPSGAAIYVTTKDVSNYAINTGTTQAVEVISETAPDSAVVTSASVGVPLASQTTTLGVASGIGLSPVAINPSTGSGMAVWEVVNTNPNQIDTINFGVYINYTAAAAANSPTPGVITVTMSYAPTPSGGAFTSTTGAAASSSLTIPRFSDSLDATKTIANISLCTTPLLFPYVINVNGFDTGIAIANTTTDPFGTAPQAGTCSYYFYGSSAPTTNPFVTPTVATGTVYANLASTLAPGFSGYMIANCNFQFAHGFAFISDVGARNLAMGYLALIIPSTSRAAVEALNN